MSIKKWVTCGIACVFVAVTVAQNKAPAPRPTYDELMKKLELAEDRLAGMRDSLMKAQKEKTEAEKATAELLARIDSLEELVAIAKEHGVDAEKIRADKAAKAAKEKAREDRDAQRKAIEDKNAFLFSDTFAVSVTEVAIRQARYVQFGQSFSTKDQHTIIYVGLVNAHPTAVERYSTWRADGDNDDKDTATLVDDLGNVYRQLEFQSHQQVIGAAASSAVYPQEPLTDILVFERPAKPAKRLILRLPGRNVGSDKDAIITMPVPISK